MPAIRRLLFTLFIACALPIAVKAGPAPRPKTAAVPEPAEMPPAFWRRIDDPVLLALVEQGLAANTDIAQALARLDAARARTRAASARLQPSLGASISTSRSLQIETFSPQSLLPEAGQLTLAYEADVSGALRQGRRAARASARAAAFDVATIRLAVACQVLRGHVVIHALDTLAQLTREQRAGIAQTAQLIDRRVAEHEAGSIEVALMAQQLAGQDAYLAQIAAARGAEVAALAVILGQNPETFAWPAGETAPDRALATITPSATQPLIVLAERPDVKAAASALDGARASQRAVRASRWPNLTLTASGVGGLSGGLPLAFANLGASLGAALFGGGAIAAREDLARADTAQTLAFYNRTRLVAAQETIAALSAMEAATARVARWDQARALVARGVETAQQAYLDGDVPINVLVDTRNDEIASRRALIEAQRDLALARIDVIRATGGTPQWEGSRGEGSRGEAPGVMANAR